jgi:hypothetical protein
MAINFNLLRQNLTVDEIEWLTQTTRYKDYESGRRAWAQLVPYKNARVDMERLDTVCGPDGWQNKYVRDSKGVLQCGIGIFNDTEWIWKWSNGVPSQFEKEKGEYSDAFKRAGFMWGIGRELYELPSLFVELKDEEFSMQEKNGSQVVKVNYKFKPSDWKWSVNWDHTDANGKNTGLIWAKQKTYTGNFEYRVKNTPIVKVW